MENKAHHPLAGNTHASKPPDERVWGKGRITADIGTDLKERLISYSRHEKRTMKEVLIRAITRDLDNEGNLDNP